MGLTQRLASAFPRMSALMGFGSGAQAYDAGRRDTRELASWAPPLSTPNDEILMTRDQIVARARDLVRNHPTVSGAIDRLTETVIGPNLWLELQPLYEAMKKTPDWSDAFSDAGEAAWEAFANDPFKRSDRDRALTLPHMFRAMYRHWLVDGEACAVIQPVQRDWEWTTSVKIIDPDRLSNPRGVADYQKMPNGNIMVGGCEVTPGGETVAYHVRKLHPAAVQATADMFTWVRIPRFSATGRPVFIHAFRYDRADQRRGMSRLAAAMSRIKMLDRYDKAELESNLLRALMAGFITSKYPTKDVRDMLAPAGDDEGGDWLAEMLDWRDSNKVRLEGVQMHHLFPEESVDFPERSGNSNYAEFSAAGDRKVAGSIGLSYPHYSQDWAGINYSSGRLMRNEMWRGLREDRELFTQAACTPVMAAWMEEAAAIGAIKIPGGPANFYRYKGHLTHCQWMGPGPGTGDPKKEADANDIELRQNTTTLADIASDRGGNWKRIVRSRSRERAYVQSLGLTDVADTPMKTGVGRPSEGGDAGEDGNRESDGQFAPKKPAKQTSPDNGGEE